MEKVPWAFQTQQDAPHAPLAAMTLQTLDLMFVALLAKESYQIAAPL